MKRTTSIYLAAVIAASMLLTACSSVQMPGASEQDPTAPQDDVAAALSEGYREPLIGADAVIEKTADHLTFAVLPSKGGQLIYTLSHLRLVDNNLEFVENGIIDGGVEVDEAEGMPYTAGWNSYRYPDFVYPDGHFVKGVHYLLIDVSVESNDAEAYTSSELDSEGYPLGVFNDPYAFSPPALTLGNTPDFVPEQVEEIAAGSQWRVVNPDECTRMVAIDYFSRRGELSDDPNEALFFKVTPGETLSFTIGFPVTDRASGGVFGGNVMSLYNIWSTDGSGKLCGITVEGNEVQFT